MDSETGKRRREEDESLEVLGAKLKALAKVNQEIIDRIEACMDNRVICGYSYSLTCQLNSSALEQTKEPWTFSSTPQQVRVSRLIQGWRYLGQEFEAAEDVFNDKIDYCMETYVDVTRLNADLLKVGSKYCDLLADKPKTRAGIRNFLTNLEIVQVALGQLNALLVNAEDTLGNSANISEGMTKIVSGFKKLQESFDTAGLTVECSKSPTYKLILLQRFT